MSRFNFGTLQNSGGNDNYTKILLHCDGVNSGTSFPDVNAGGTARTWTSVSGFTFTGLSKFGTASLSTGVGYITTPAHSSFNLGSADFTLDFWVSGSPSGVYNNKSVMGQCDSGQVYSASSLFVFTDGASKPVIGACVGNSIFPVFATTALTASTAWYHVAFVRTGNILKLFINGVQEGGNVAITGSVNSSSSSWSIGRTGDSTTDAMSTGTAGGLFDEIRLSAGIARWTSNFTPPTIAYS